MSDDTNDVAEASTGKRKSIDEQQSHSVNKRLKNTNEAFPADKPSTESFNPSDHNSDYSETRLPLHGTPVNRRLIRRAGPYIIGPKLGYSPVDSIVQYLAKKENTDEFVQLKILMISADTNSNATNEPADEKMMQDERQGKMLLHTEYSLLSLLQNQDGVIHHHGMFSVSTQLKYRISVRLY